MNSKALLLSSAAAMIVASGTQAADLPSAEPVEYVRVCDAFGTGFFYIPGTDTCIRMSGFARYEAHWVEDDREGDEFNNFTTRARGQVNFDARTMTDLGLLRSYIELRGTIGPADTGGYSDGFNLNQAWLSLSNDMGTLTAGHHLSFYDFFGGKAMDTRIGLDDPTDEVNLLAYSFLIGNGLSASLSIEDKTFRRYGVLIGAGGGGISLTTPSSNSDGQEIPDFVANIRIDQGWGSAQIMGVGGRVGATDAGGFGSDDAFGYAAGLGLSLKVPMTGVTFSMQADYAEGLVRYVTTGNDALLFDAVENVAGTGISLTEAWAAKAGLGADITSTISASLDGAYADIDHNGMAAGIDYDTWIVAGTVHWKPVSGLTISGELAYEDVNYDAGAGVDDFDVWGAMMRINRSF